MKNLVRGFFLTLPFLLWQSNVSACDNLTIDARLTNESALDIFFLKDFDINSTSSGPPIFFVDIRNNSPDTSCTIILALTVLIQEDVLGEGETGEITLGRNEPPLMLTNNNLFSSTDPYRLVTFEINEQAAQSVQDALSRTGKLPTNTYTFNFVARNVDNQTPPVQDNVVIEVSNQSMPPDLTSPGGPASNGMDDSFVIYSTLPQFRWETNLGTCRVIIAEALPGEDPESSLNQEPRFTRTFIIQTNQGSLLPTPPLPPGVPDSPTSSNAIPFNDQVETIASTSFQYPASGEILTLREGKSYYWRVVGLAQTSSGLFEIESEIFCFSIAKVDEIAVDRTQLELILSNLLGPREYLKLFGEGGELQGQPFKRVTLNGEEMTLAELMGKLQELSTTYQGYKVE